jgi:hypothetical protein
VALAGAVGSLSIGLMGAVPASAAPVSSTSVTPGAVTPTPDTAGSNASYSIPFTTASALPASDTITFVAPSGTDFTGCTSSCGTLYSISVNNGRAATLGSAAVSAVNGSATNNQVVLTLASSTITASDTVTVTTQQTTNPQAAGTAYTMQESTSEDTQPASSPAYSIVASSPAMLQPVAGNGQSAQVDTKFPTGLAVKVTDANNNPISGAAVTFTAPATTGASGTFASCSGNSGSTPPSQCIVATGSDGTATASDFTADATPGGPYQVTASVAGGTGTLSTSFDLTNTAAPPATVTGGTVTVSPTTERATPATYTVKLTTNHAVPNGGTITLTAPNGTMMPSSSCDPTGVLGCSPADYAVTYPGTGSTTTVPVTGVATSSAQGPDFDYTSTSSNQVAITVGPIGSGTAIPASTVVTVTITGVTNTWMANPAYFLFESDSADTTAVDSGNFAITPGAATQLLEVSGDGQSAAVTRPFPQPLVVVAEDHDGNPVSQGTSVIFVLPDGSNPSQPSGTFPGGSIQQTNQTNASGQVSSSTITANTVAGDWSATAELPGDVSPVDFFLTNNPGPSAINPTSGTPQSTTINTAFADPLVATVTDADGNPVSGVPVTFSAPTGAGAASGTFASCSGDGVSTPDTECVVITAGDGTATSSAFTANTTAGGPYSVQATVPGVTTPANFQLTNNPGPAVSLTRNGGNQSAQVASGFAQPLSVTAKDANGNPVSGVTVDFAVPTSGPSATFAGSYTPIVTDPNGVAATPAMTANTKAGNWVATAEIDSQPSTLVSWTETNTAGPAAQIVLPASSGSGQSIHVGQPFGLPLQAEVTDVYGNPIAGQTVTFTMPASGPTASFARISGPASGRTGSNGIILTPGVVAGLRPGSYRATASTTFSGAVHTVQYLLTNTEGYWLAGSDGSIQAFGDAHNYGSTAGIRLNQPVVGMAALPNGSGYWLVARDGGIFSFGHARFHGSTGGVALNKPVVAIAATPDGGGYWLVASDGGLFNYGDAKFYGSLGNVKLAQPIVGMAVTPDGRGYWMVASDGGIFAFGDAKFYGSMGGKPLNKPVVGMVPAPGGTGYWLVASDGGIFAFGRGARFFGSTGNIRLAQPIVGMTAAASGLGYWFVAHDGGLFAFGPDAPFRGSGAGKSAPVVGMAEG